MGLNPRLGHHVIPSSSELKQGILDEIKLEYPEYADVADDDLWGMLSAIMFERADE